jgi:hypothetical protein
MGCAFGVAVVILGLSLPRPAAADNENGPGLTLNLTFDARHSVRRAVTRALVTLARPGCSRIFEDFELPDGRTPRNELDRLGIGAETLIRSLVFVDGSSDPVCRNGRAVLTTTPGSRLIRVCPGFAQLDDPSLRAVLVLHESLHALGLGENPPSSRDITNRVEHLCW